MIQLANAYQAANPQEQQQDQHKRDLVAAAVLWLTSQGVDLTAPLAPLMPGLIADGWLIGAASGQAMTDGGDADTAGWKPGDTDTAAGQVGALGLAAKLRAAQAAAGQSAQAVAHDYLTRLGRVLVEGVAAGAAAAETGKALLSVLADTAKAAAAALGQLVTAIGQAAMAWYRQQRVEYGRWLTEGDAKVCATCLANEAAGRVPIGDLYPSGDADAPAHDRCRCVVVPD